MSRPAAPPTPAMLAADPNHPFRAFHDRHRGERCYILGNGPSLNKTDVRELRGAVTFGVNSIFLMNDVNGFLPTYYVVEDNLVFRDNQQRIERFGGVTKLLPRQYADALQAGRDNLHSFEMDASFYDRKDPSRYAVPHFNEGADPLFHCGQSVTYINLQLAYYMGFAEVVLLGMDFSYSMPSGHTQQGNHIHSDADDTNHFHKDYFGKGKTWKDPRLGRVLRSYHRAKFVYACNGRRILNATPGGQLTLFDRVDFRSLVG